MAPSKSNETHPFVFGINEGLTCGYDNGLPVIRDYEVPFTFSGNLKRVVVIPHGEEHVDHQKRLERELLKE